MRRIALWSSIAVLVVIVAVVFARVDVRRGWCGHGWYGHPNAFGYIARGLDLNQAQRQQVQSLWQSEKPTMMSLVSEFAAESKEMDQATANGNLDESKVQEIAQRQGATVAKLLVEKEHFRSKVYANVLTPAQRTKADELQAKWHERLSHIGKF
jgi:Spy/CpxP family protein refolding chaperone